VKEEEMDPDRNKNMLWLSVAGLIFAALVLLMVLVSILYTNNSIFGFPPEIHSMLGILDASLIVVTFVGIVLLLALLIRIVVRRWR
jgi:hypothetical protein